MYRARRERTQHEMNRRRFVEISARFATTLIALPAASSLLTGCGGDESSRSPAPPAPAPSRSNETTGGNEGNPVPAAPPAKNADDDKRLVTEIASAAALVAALQYADPSPMAPQRCATCQLYTAESSGLGRCQLFPQGLVQASAWCASWAARADA